MPNWCYTEYVAMGGKEQLDNFERVLDELQYSKEPRIENGFGNLWLGCLLDCIEEDWHDIPCRGQILDYKMEETKNGERVLKFNTETAWGPCHEVFRRVKNWFPELEFVFYTEEESMEFFETNDSTGEFFPWNYHVYIETPEDGETELLRTVEEVADFINGFHIDGLVVEPDEDKIREALEAYQEENDDFYYSFSKIKLDTESGL